MIKELIAEVRRLAKEYPEAHYKMPDSAHSCKYLTGNSTNGPEFCGCIFGVAAQSLNNQPLIDLMKSADIKFDGESIGSILYNSQISRLSSEKEKLWCGTVQHRQDKQESWSQAVSYADTLFPEVSSQSV